jgi:protein involved in polysaccharide export with SLBB domain
VRFKAIGQVKLGGLTVPQAAKAIQSAFGRKNGAAIFHAQIEKVEAMPLVTVNGAVRSPGAIQWFDGLTVSQALNAVGGHDASAGRAVYVIREGVSRFHESADNSTLEAGDTVSFSSDL